MTTPVPADPRLASLRVAGAVITYRLYDVGYALDLERAARLLEGQATGRPRPMRGEAKALVIAQPPLTLALGPVTLPGGHAWPAAQMSACCYDFGVISLRLRVGLPDESSWPDLVALTRALERADLASVFGPALSQLTSQLAPAVTRPAVAPVAEDYTICRLTALRDATGAGTTPGALDDVPLVELLLGEPRALTEDARRHLLSRRFSYTDHDLAVLSWDAALVIEPAAGDQDVEFVLEFANAQLLELRVYDAYLDAELPQLYDRASLARRGPAALLVRRFEHVLAGLHTLVADTTEVVERVENGLKVTNDVYLARIYQAALAMFREDAWRLGVARKLGIFRDTYAMLNDEAQTARGNVLEVIIILLIVIEVVMGLIRQ
ncbi:MAG TPA: hypothetical protein VFJ81_09545 [Gemmatimonadales bacterium]|nr:hypothetical protein [Gemmatimonadales bacterium]